MSSMGSRAIKGTRLQEILQGISDLETPVLESFYQEVADMVAKRKAKVLSQKESELFLVINKPSLPPVKKKLFNDLYAKLQDETITKDEKSILDKLIIVQEQQGVKRLEALISLAQLRNTTLPQIMKDLGIPKITPDAEA